MILRNSKGFLQMCKMFTLLEQRNVMIEIIFTYRECYKKNSFECFRIILYRAYAVDTLRPLLLTLVNRIV